MTDKIILNIHHSDDYTDYLFLTAGLTNKRIIPMIDPSPAEIKAKSDCNTTVIGCYNFHKEPGPNDSVASYNEMTHNIHLFSRFYLLDDGTVNATQAELARATIQEVIVGILFSENNLHEYYRRYFPLFWRKRKQIYDTSLMFYAKTGMFCTANNRYIPLGIMLKTIEGNEDLFRTRQGGGCHCEIAPLLIDYNPNYGDWYNTSWTLYTWCPQCSSRREVNIGYIDCYEARLANTYRDYDRKQGLSAFTLFDVVDTLSITK